jgi:Flp pilus assembly protein CpaB
MGMRAVGIWVDPDETAAGLVDVGDHVDVVATHKLTWDKGPNQFVIGAQGFTAGRTIAQDLVVLAVDRSIEAPTPTPTAAAPAPGAPNGAPAAGGAPPPPPPAPTAVPAPGSAAAKTRVLVAAKPDVAAHLIAANDQGVLNITIRNPLDANENKPVPEAHEYPSRVVTIKPVAAKPQKAESPWSIFAPPRMPAMPKTGSRLPSPVTVTVPGTPAPVPTRDVTVIRGTEKTRVLLPR